MPSTSGYCRGISRGALERVRFRIAVWEPKAHRAPAFQGNDLGKRAGGAGGEDGFGCLTAVGAGAGGNGDSLISRLRPLNIPSAGRTP